MSNKFRISTLILSGQKITADSASLYLNDIPISGGNFSGNYTSESFVTGISGFLQNQINNISGNYALLSDLSALDFNLQTQINDLNQRVINVSGELNYKINSISGVSGQVTIDEFLNERDAVLNYNTSGTLISYSDFRGTKTFQYDVNGNLTGYLGIGDYRSKTFYYDSSGNLTGINVI